MSDYMKRMDCDSKNIHVYGIEQFKNSRTPINVQFVSIGDQTAGTVHTHEYIQIVYVYRGECRHLICENEFFMVKGDIVVLPPFVPHYLEKAGNEEFQIIECEFMPFFINENIKDIIENRGVFDFAYIEPFLVAENQAKPGLKLSGEAQNAVEEMLLDMVGESERKIQGYELYLKACLLKLLVILGRRFDIYSSETSGRNALLNRHRKAIFDAIGFINGSYCSDITLEDACRHALMSRSYFCYLFKLITGKTLIEYVNELRVKKAMELLCMRKDLSVTEICYKVGFQQIIHFSRVFKKIAGVSPNTYRKVKSRNWTVNIY